VLNDHRGVVAALERRGRVGWRANRSPMNYPWGADAIVTVS
jgi:hypothetical protein